MKRVLIKHLTFVVVVIGLLTVWLYWPDPLSPVEQQLVGDWVLVSKFGVQRVELRADRRIVFRHSPEEPVSVWEIRDGQLELTHRYQTSAFGQSLPFRHEESFAWKISGDPAQGFLRLESMGQLADGLLIRCDEWRR